MSKHDLIPFTISNLHCLMRWGPLNRDLTDSEVDDINNLISYLLNLKDIKDIKDFHKLPFKYMNDMSIYLDIAYNNVCCEEDSFFYSELSNYVLKIVHINYVFIVEQIIYITDLHGVILDYLM